MDSNDQCAKNEKEVETSGEKEENVHFLICLNT
jgi:hypothetical protein